MIVIFTGDPTSVQQTLGPFDDQRRRRECDGQEENDSIDMQRQQYKRIITIKTLTDCSP